MQTPIVLIGAGEIGGVFARGFLKQGQPIYPLTRHDSPTEIAAHLPECELVLVTVGEADLDADQVVTVQELYNFIFANVRSYTGNRQSPVIKGDYDETMMVAVKR
mgnify:CR=1 FL=1